MKVSQIVEIIAGELGNSPAISAFNGVAVSLSTLKRGGLFFAKNADEIEAAVSMGAYGIVYDSFAQMIDAEIAWIKVGNLQESIARLVRYFLINKSIEVFYLKPLEFEIFSQICTDERVLFYNNSLENLLEKISQDIPCKGVVASSDGFLDLALDYTRSITPREKVLEINIATLFDMKVYYKLSRYDLLLPALFFNELSAVVYLAQSYQIEFDLRLFRGVESVMPSFIDTTPRLLEYGQSARVVIAQKNLEDFRNYAEYIAQNGKWGKLVGFVPNDVALGADDFDFPIAHYEDSADLLRAIGREDFHFGLVYGMSNPILISLLNRPRPMPMRSLF